MGFAKESGFWRRTERARAADGRLTDGKTMVGRLSYAACARMTERIRANETERSAYTTCARRRTE